MLARTHLAFGFLSALIIFQFIEIEGKIIFVCLVLFASILPDIDSPKSMINKNIPIVPMILSLFVKHRGIFHSIFLAVLIPGTVGYFAGQIYGVALFVGYLSHLLMDSMTKAGINFLHPFGKFHLSGFIETGSFLESVCFILIVVGIIIEFF